MPPELEITAIPLKDDNSSASTIQEMEWKQAARQHVLPRVPTINDDRQAGGVGGGVMPGRRTGLPVSPTDPNAPYRRQPVMPVAPTEAGELGTNRPSPGTMPTVPGAYHPANTVGGYRPGYGPGNYSPSNGQGYVGNRPSQFNAPTFSQPVQPGLSGAMTSALQPPVTPTTSNYLNRTTAAQYMNIPGVDQNPFLTQPAAGTGDAAKPFADYQRPNGYSPWMSLYNTPTSNGTVDPYTSAVLPAMQQQQYNQQIGNQVRGMQQMQGMYGGTPGTEVPVGGAGMANPSAFQNYGNYR